MNTLNLFVKAVDTINEWTGKILHFGLFFLFLLIIIEVLLRYGFNSPTVWTNELCQLIFGVYVILAGGYVLKNGGHVNVDILYSRFSIKRRAIIDIITFPLFFSFCSMLLLYGGSLACESLARLEHSQTAWNPPLYPVKLMIPTGAALVLLQGTAKFIRDIFRLVNEEEITTPEGGGR